MTIPAVPTSLSSPPVTGPDYMDAVAAAFDAVSVDIGAVGLTFTPRMYGAVGDGDPANSAADTAGLQAAINAFFNALPGLPNTPGPAMTMDLQGGCYILESGLLAPTRSYVGRFLIKNGILQFKDSVTAGTEDMLDLRPLTLIYQGAIENVFFNGFKSDNTVAAASLLMLPNCRGFQVIGGGFACFTDYGILVDSTDYGQAVRVARTFIQGYLGSGTFPSGNEGIYFKGGDNVVEDTTVGDCDTLVHFGKDSAMLKGCHIWNYSTASITGIVCDIAKSIQINGNYIDTVKLILKGASSGSYHFHGNNIVGNKFYLPPGGTGTARGTWTGSDRMIEYAPQAAGSEVSQDVIVGNTFIDDGGTVPISVGVDTTSGTITTVSGTTVEANSFYGFQGRWSDPWGHISISASTSGTRDFSSLIPFGAVQRVKGSSLQATTAANLRFGISGNIVTATVSASLTGTVRVQASINSAEGF